MANNVFANGRELSCKSGSGKSVAAFPDVCMTPPENPATPPGVPVPYPNNGMASDMSGGSKNVKISGKEVMLKNKSYFKKSTGDEAGCAAKKGVVTSTNRGKVYFTMWSMDVKIEGENAVRHLDMTTHNHASGPGNSPPWAFLDSAHMSDGDCKEQSKKTEKCVEKHMKKNTFNVHKKKHRKPGQTVNQAYTDDLAVDWLAVSKEDNFYNKKAAKESFCNDDEDNCKDLLKCNIVPYDWGCCDGKTPHHVVPQAQFHQAAGDPLPLESGGTYDFNKAGCICVDGNSHSTGTHGDIHGETNTRTRAFLGVPAATAIPKQKWPLAFAERIGAEAVEAVTGCNKHCIQDQVRATHARMKIERSDKVRPMHAGGDAKPGQTII